MHSYEKVNITDLHHHPCFKSFPCYLPFVPGLDCEYSPGMYPFLLFRLLALTALTRCFPCPHDYSHSALPRLEIRRNNSRSNVTTIKDPTGFVSVNESECGSPVTKGSVYQPLDFGGAPWLFLHKSSTIQAMSIIPNLSTRGPQFQGRGREWFPCLRSNLSCSPHWFLSLAHAQS